MDITAFMINIMLVNKNNSACTISLTDSVKFGLVSHLYHLNLYWLNDFLIEAWVDNTET